MTTQSQAITAGQGQTAIPAAGPVRTTRNTLDQQAFLQILVSKLQNQDPMSPMEDQDFIAQMAQFSALEQMQLLNSGFGFAQAAGLVGKHVQATLPDPMGGVQRIDGLVTHALMRNGVPNVVVNDREVPYDGSLVIYAPQAAPAAEPAGADPANG